MQRLRFLNRDYWNPISEDVLPLRDKKETLKTRNQHRKSVLIFYILLGYILLQITWWMYQIIILARQVDDSGGLFISKVKMIAGEFAVFMVLMVIGVFWIYKVFNKELLLSQSKKNFSLSVTHELKTPIAASKLFIETILARELPKEKTDELLGKVLNEQDRLQVLIDKILLSARLNNTKMKIDLQSVNLFELIEQSIEKTNSIDITVNKVDPNLFFALDPFYFSSVINNLHENAVKYSQIDPKIIWSAKIVNNDVVIAIEDNGCGIKAEDRAKIFEMYHRSEDEETKSIQGTGLGLFLVLKMVQLHKGVITVSDSSLGGTKFEIRLAK